MQKVFSLIPRVAESTSTVVIEGETGTGKELVARAIHNMSPRRDEPFVAINCGALPDSLLESELFGHKAGAFTDARKDKPGRFELANGGTIFLDEISDVSPAMQVRLLRVLQEGEVEPLGGVEAVPVDVRVIAATNRPLETLVKQGRFRDDLYYRIRVIHIVLPPLRQRREDIPLLVDGLIAKFNHLQGKQITGVSTHAMNRLMLYHYPGNVRELENIIEQAFVLRPEGEIQEADLPPELQGPDASAGVGGTLESLERSAIEAALQRNGGHRNRAAKELGIDPSTLYRKMKALGIRPPTADGRRR
jgi:transcriptional regulator with PAS, ATPase and Fis domain